MLQLHYYHERFVLLVDENTEFSERGVGQSKRERNNRELRRSLTEGNEKSRRVLHLVWIKASAFAEAFKRIAWKLLEIHRWKICAITVIMSARVRTMDFFL